MLITILIIIAALLAPIQLYLLGVYALLAIGTIWLMVKLYELLNHILTVGPITWYVNCLIVNPFGTIVLSSALLIVITFLVWLYMLPMPKENRKLLKSV